MTCWSIRTAARATSSADAISRRTPTWIDKWKVFIGRAAPGTGDRRHVPAQDPQQAIHRRARHRMSPRPISCIGPFDSESEATNVSSRTCARRFVALPGLAATSHRSTPRASVYTFVPTARWIEEWTDEELYAKYGITDGRDRVHREASIRPMDVSGRR